ncbi:divalent-cation tolerance protein CutA [Solihabitans fulvus]|uniref:Divalent-cation tolerance protein CutA n=1 Tax=Solihabitans fulvus TaxID=1892852 RepID=A0A5B2WYB9_9PSEU|nr:divalent-cation tolerance protein CutA [Solihabitans fulvus]KAA2254907.1 divalent-cation tolerance protein CutA [Solihabitans fulvus]
MTEHRVVITTTGSAEAAEALARGVVEARLAACVQIVGPVTSVYRWEGAVQTDQEWQCVVKTTAERLDELAAHIRGHHEYELPEVVAIPVVGGLPEYLAWVTEETS